MKGLHEYWNLLIQYVCLRYCICWLGAIMWVMVLQHFKVNQFPFSWQLGCNMIVKVSSDRHFQWQLLPKIIPTREQLSSTDLFLCRWRKTCGHVLPVHSGRRWDTQHEVMYGWVGQVGMKHDLGEHRPEWSLSDSCPFYSWMKGR